MLVSEEKSIEKNEKRKKRGRGIGLALCSSFDSSLEGPEDKSKHFPFFFEIGIVFDWKENPQHVSFSVSDDPWESHGFTGKFDNNKQLAFHWKLRACGFPKIQEGSLGTNIDARAGT